MDGNPKEYHRFLTSGFIHADMMHLMFNMLSLYFFGDIANIYAQSNLLYVVLYLSAIVVASLPSFIKNRNNSYYRSLGASGGVSAIVFFTIFYSPFSKITLLGLPPQMGIPSILYGVIYIAYTWYMSKKTLDNINHDAHLWGSLYGFVYALVIDPTHGQLFWWMITHPGQISSTY
jgi:membrane associated rhomboid family serine protease